jgi:hypothetical protein
MSRDNKDFWPFYDIDTDYKNKERNRSLKRRLWGTCSIKGGHIMLAPKITRDQEDDGPSNPIDDLRQRVEELESNQYVTEEQLGVLIGIIRILSEMPAGQQILNRALNLQKLEKLQQHILPRRKQDLAELMDMKMPEGIREDMCTRQLKLIQQTLRHVTHRRHFENTSATAVRSTMESFFKKIRSYSNKALIHKGGPDVPTA